MENTNVCSDSWRSYSSRTSHPSQWLQTTLSDLDEKIKAVLTAIDANGKILFQKRAQLTQMIADLCRSYQSLAEKYDKLSSGNSSFSSDSRKLKEDFGSSFDSQFNSGSSSAVEDAGDELDVANIPCNTSIDTALEDMKIINFDLNRKTFGDFMMGTFDGKKNWSELKFQVTKLMEENLRQQGELIKRNNEKKGVIKELHCQLKQVKEENRALRSSLRGSNISGNEIRGHKSKLKSLILCKYFN